MDRFEQKHICYMTVLSHNNLRKGQKQKRTSESHNSQKKCQSDKEEPARQATPGRYADLKKGHLTTKQATLKQVNSEHRIWDTSTLQKTNQKRNNCRELWKSTNPKK